MKASGIKMEDVVVAGVDATADALAAMTEGDLDVTVFQDAGAEGRGAVDAAIRLAKCESVDQKVCVPFQLVTPENFQEYLNKN
jgi:inositol transport system substrate-binding protein